MPTKLPLLALAALLALPGCSEQAEPAASAPAEQGAATEGEPLREVEVAEASALFTAGTARPVDANSPATREAFGVVPGAVLLSGGNYDLSELPADVEQLVFYCSNTYCTASDNAARRAREAGREVAVMRAGIAGWKEAGQPTEPPAS